jgi:putative tricarboxylic transport membrane protein
METSQRSADIIAGIFLALVGSVVMVAALELKSTFGERLHPRVLPLFLGSTTLLAGALLSIRARWYRGEELTVEWPDKEGRLRLGVTFVSLTAYLALVEPIGMAAASLLFSTFLIWYLDRKFVRSLCLGIVVTIIIQVVFVGILQLSFPAGFWAR